MSIKIYHPDGSLPYTDNVVVPNASSHIAANDQWAAEAAMLLAYHTGDFGCWTETDSGVTDGGVDWAEYEYDHEAAKDAIRYSDWDTVTTFGSTFPDGDGVGACDVSVRIGQCGDNWYLSTSDDAGGSDDCDATPYSSREDAEAAAKEYATEHDECDGMSAEEYFEHEREQAIQAAKSDDGEWVLVHKDGTRWDDDRYSDRDAAEAKIKSWYDGVKVGNPGTDIIWQLMDTPELGCISEDGEIEVVADERE